MYTVDMLVFGLGVVLLDLGLLYVSQISSTTS